MWYKNIAGRFFGLVTKHACDRRTDRQTDRRTDGQNYDSQDRASIAASRGKNKLHEYDRMKTKKQALYLKLPTTKCQMYSQHYIRGSCHSANKYGAN